jgi:hypothetical protein
MGLPARASDPVVRDRIVFGAAALFLLLPPGRELLEAGWRIGEIWGVDYELYTSAARRWLEGGLFYPAEQFAGPFVDDGRRILYPPTSLLLFLPFAFLPAALWWAIPAGIIAWQVHRLRPAPLVWPFLGICIAWPATPLTIVVGNPAIWFVALLALGTLHHWPAAIILIKPVVAPFAIWGIRHRSWWIALGCVLVVGLPFGTLWIDWVRILTNSRVGGVLHSVEQFPLFVFPLLVWAGRAGGPLVARWERTRPTDASATAQQAA